MGENGRAKHEIQSADAGGGNNTPVSLCRMFAGRPHLVWLDCFKYLNCCYNLSSFQSKNTSKYRLGLLALKHARNEFFEIRKFGSSVQFGGKWYVCVTALALPDFFS